jgi:hypothetical protein
MRALVRVTGDPNGDVLHDGELRAWAWPDFARSLRGEEWLMGDMGCFR